MRPRSIALIAALAVAIPATGLRAQSSSGPSGALTVSLTQGPFQPGGVAAVTVTSSTPLRSVTGQALGRPLTFWSVTGLEWRALVGVGLDTAPGQHSITVRGIGDGDVAHATTVPFPVQRRVFETRRLSVAPQMANPPPEEAARIAAETRLMAAAFATMTTDRLWRGRFDPPVPGAATSSFGRLTVTNGRPSGRHQGADFRAATGTPVHAPNAGRVLVAQDLYFAGNTVIVDHGLGVFSLLAHLSRIDVKVGDVVPRGHQVGQSGATGRVTGPHLHWAVRFGEMSVDPVALMTTVAALPDADAQ